MDETTADLITLVESLKLRVCALEDALLNLAGFTKVADDNSQQGRIVFEPKQSPVLASEGVSA